MSFSRAFSPALREIRILCSHSGPASAGTRRVYFLSSHHSQLTLLRRQFIFAHYPAIKQYNPDLPVLIREATGTPARAFARFGALCTRRAHCYPPHACPFIPTERGVEKHVELDDLSAPEVEAKIARLLQS